MTVTLQKPRMPRTIFYKGAVPRSAWALPYLLWNNGSHFVVGTCPGTIEIHVDMFSTGTGIVKRMTADLTGAIIIQVVSAPGVTFVTVPADPGGYPVVAVENFGGLGSDEGASDPGCPP